jgi:hypothetical protein
MGRCLSENTLQALVAGLLPGDVLTRARAHIERCSSCRSRVVELGRGSRTEPLATATAPTITPSTTAAPAIGERRPITRAFARRFEIIRPVGRGGMGTVYEAFDRERGARIALKTLQHVSAGGLLRFKNEFRALQDVEHPNLVTLGELIEDHGQWWLTMELVDGVGLLEHVRPGGLLDETRLRAALILLASALQALHARGLVHRDVKPHNVLVTPAGRVVLLDFGLVTRVDQSESNVVGTPAYMAPEQCRVQEVGPAADWYAVGALLYEALTGVKPFEGPLLHVIKAKQEARPRRPCELASVPADLDALCMDLLAVDPAARPDAAAVLARLEPTAIGAAPAARAMPLFVGRAYELAVLGDAFARARAGQEAIVLVEGESGIGKSALVRHFTEDLRRREPGVVVLAGRCYQRETVPYKAFDGVVDALARHLRKLPRAEAAAVLPRRAALLVQAFPVLARVPALRTLPAAPAFAPQELRVRAFAAMRELLGRLAERAPLVVCIDDLQWADADSLELLGYVMAPPEAPPLLLITTSRPHRAEAIEANAEAGMVRLRELPSLRVLALARLARDEAVRLVEHLLAETPVGDASAEAMADEAEGHPLFIEALVRFAARDPAARPGIHLGDVLWARVRALDPPARQLLLLVAVAGWPLSLALVVAMAVLPGGALEAAIARLRQAHLLRLADGPGKGALEPYHDRVREAVLDHLDVDTRKQCHRALATALLALSAAAGGGAALAPRDVPAAGDTPPPPGASDVLWDAEVIAVHLHGAGELAQAAHYLVLAADKAAAALAFDRAARLYRQALELHAQAGEPADVFGPGGARDVRARLARTFVHASRGAEAAAVYLELAGMAAASGEEDIQLRLMAAEQFLRSGHVQAGQRVLDPVLGQLGIGRAATRLGALWRFLWRRAWLRVRGFGYRERAGAGLTARERLRMDACAVACTLTEDVSPDFMVRYQLMALRAGDPVRVGVALCCESFYAYGRGAAAAPRTARIIEQLTTMATRTGAPYLLGLTSTVCCLIEWAQGHWARSREHGAQALQIFHEHCPEAAHERALALFGYLHSMIALGALRDLARELPPLLRDADERRDRFTLAALHGPAAFQWLIQDQPEMARRQLWASLALWKPDQRDSQIFPEPIWYTRIALYQGDGATAYRYIDGSMRRLRQLSFRDWSRFLRGLAALAACRSGEFDRHALVRAVARDARGLRALGMTWSDAFARLLDAGSASVVGNHALARDHLERAHAELTASGTTLYATMARRRLGELIGGAEGQDAIAAADAWLRAEGVVSPERLTRAFMPEVA